MHRVVAGKIHVLRIDFTNRNANLIGQLDQTFYSSILAALMQRDKRGGTGKGSHIDISMLEALTEWMGYPMYYAYEGAAPPPRMMAPSEPEEDEEPQRDRALDWQPPTDEPPQKKSKLSSLLSEDEFVAANPVRTKACLQTIGDQLMMYAMRVVNC